MALQHLNRWTAGTRRGVYALPLVLLACGGDESPQGGTNTGPPLISDTRRDDFLYEATLDMSPAPHVLLGAVTITNTASVPRTLAFHDSCTVTLLAYKGLDQVWDERDTLLCTSVWDEYTLLPGMAQAFPIDILVSDLFATSTLAPGVYTVTLQLTPFPAHVQQSSDVELYGGEFDLQQ